MYSRLGIKGLAQQSACLPHRIAKTDWLAVHGICISFTKCRRQASCACNNFAALTKDHTSLISNSSSRPVCKSCLALKQEDGRRGIQR